MSGCIDDTAADWLDDKANDSSDMQPSALEHEHFAKNKCDPSLAIPIDLPCKNRVKTATKKWYRKPKSTHLNFPLSTIPLSTLTKLQKRSFEILPSTL